MPQWQMSRAGRQEVVPVALCQEEILRPHLLEVRFPEEVAPAWAEAALLLQEQESSIAQAEYMIPEMDR